MAKKKKKKKKSSLLETANDLNDGELVPDPPELERLSEAELTGTDPDPEADWLAIALRSADLAFQAVGLERATARALGMALGGLPDDNGRHRAHFLLFDGDGVAGAREMLLSIASRHAGAGTNAREVSAGLAVAGLVALEDLRVSAEPGGRPSLNASCRRDLRKLIEASPPGNARDFMTRIDRGGARAASSPESLALELHELLDEGGPPAPEHEGEQAPVAGGNGIRLERDAFIIVINGEEKRSSETTRATVDWLRELRDRPAEYVPLSPFQRDGRQINPTDAKNAVETKLGELGIDPEDVLEHKKGTGVKCRLSWIKST